MSPKELWESNPAELNDIIEGKMEILEAERMNQNFGAAMICATLGNCNGGKKGGGSFTVQDFMPIKEAVVKQEPQTPERQAFLLKLFAAIAEREGRK